MVDYCEKAIPFIITVFKPFKDNEKFEYMQNNNGYIPEKMKTNKFAQKVLKKWTTGKPNITITSLPTIMFTIHNQDH